MDEVRFADTTIRDGHLSLWANKMRTSAMLAIAPMLDRAGFESIETMYSHPKQLVRELKEDPWERLRLLRQHVTETPLRAISARFKAFELFPPVLYELSVKCLADVGIRQTRISDEWNQFEMWKWKVGLSRQFGMDPIVNLIFSESPKHTDAYYAERTRQASSLDVYRLCLKDPGGLLTPERMRTLVPTVLANANGKYVELHSHCTTGIGPLNALEAVKLGIRTLNVGVPPLANGSALPSVFSVAKNLRAMDYQPVIDEEILRPVSDLLTRYARQSGFPLGRPVEYDAAQYAHQVPGGMISNLRRQLWQIGLEDKMEETLEECARVRMEWGYPIMVTPLSQFVGTQAAINIIAGERYREVSDQTIHYALGRWGGQEAIDAMDPNVRDRILSRPRARELAAWEPPNPTLADIRKEFDSSISDEEMLLRLEVHEEDIQAMRAAGPSPDGLDAGQPLVNLIRSLTKRSDRNFFHLEKGATKITLARCFTQMKE